MKNSKSERLVTSKMMNEDNNREPSNQAEQANKPSNQCKDYSENILLPFSPSIKAINQHARQPMPTISVHNAEGYFLNNHSLIIPDYRVRKNYANE